MSVIYVLFAASGVLGLAFLFLFIRSVREGQFDDTWSPARRMLVDDDKVIRPDGRTTNGCRDAVRRPQDMDQGT